ncbi:MAG: hypothetical protein IJI66_14690 [Erysipelotrichaceae bacterium]|nr:hypothetical protein [Erysipelotrichaceae bacterium]
MHKQNHNRWLFVGFLLLAGALHSFDPASEFYVSIIFCAEYLIYAGMILFWIQSVNRRLSSTWAKRYLMSAACLMLLFVIAQLTKFRIAVSPGLIRYCWYIYYIPILSIPTLFMMACFRLFAGSEQRKPHELCFLLPAVMLTLGILTNDLHKLAFIPGTVIAEMTGAPNTYTHGILYYMVYAWVGGTMAAGIILLLIACRKLYELY